MQFIKRKKEKHAGSRNRLKRLTFQKEIDALFEKMILGKDKHSLWYIFWNMEKEGLRPRAWEELKKIGFCSDDAQKLYEALDKIDGKIGPEIETFFVEEATPDSLSCAMQFKSSMGLKKNCFKRLREKFEEGHLSESYFKNILINLLECSGLKASSFEELKKLHLSSEEINEIIAALQGGDDKGRLKEIRKIQESKKRSMKTVMEMHKILERIKDLKEQ